MNLEKEFDFNYYHKTKPSRKNFFLKEFLLINLLFLILLISPKMYMNNLENNIVTNIIEQNDSELIKNYENFNRIKDSFGFKKSSQSILQIEKNIIKYKKFKLNEKTEYRISDETVKELIKRYN